MPQDRRSSLEMSPEEFRKAGYELVDRLAEFWADPHSLPVTPGDDPERVWGLVERRRLPESGSPPREVLKRAFDTLVQGSLLNGHPKFFGYITAGAAPIGVLSELLAAGFNPNCGGWPLSPAASAIEIQTVEWIAELIGYQPSCGGLMCSGGNMANLLGFWTAASKAPRGAELCAYAAESTHTWINKAATLSDKAVRSVPVDPDERMDLAALRSAIESDLEAGRTPFLIVATAGTVSTGAIDDLEGVRALCDEFDLWMHVDGAYGAFAACLPEMSELRGIALADSLALDPHKWLYAPLEAGCVLVRDKSALLDAFSHRPPYYAFHREDSNEWCNFYELGVQNSRGFRALKVWTALQQAGRNGYTDSIRDDIALTRAMADYASEQPEIEVKSCRLSIVTFRFVPSGPSDLWTTERLNSLNQRIVSQMQSGGEAFVSNAIIGGEYFMRACIVNFRTQPIDVTETIDLAVRLGRQASLELG